MEEETVHIKKAFDIVLSLKQLGDILHGDTVVFEFFAEGVRVMIKIEDNNIIDQYWKGVMMNESNDE